MYLQRVSRRTSLASMGQDGGCVADLSSLVPVVEKPKRGNAFSEKRSSHPLLWQTVVFPLIGVLQRLRYGEAKRRQSLEET